MADNLDFFPVKPSGTERNNFAKQNGHLRLPRALKSSSMPPGFFYFTIRKQTTSGLLQRVAIGDVLYAQAGFGQTGSKPVKKSVSTFGGGAEASRRKLQPVPGVRIVECGAKEESEKETKRRERGRERRERLPPSSSALPHPVVVCFFFFAHISLRCPHDLNAWNRLWNCGKKRLSCFHRISIHNNVIPKYLDNALADFA